MIEEGRAYTPGHSFRARAEAQQRRYRAQELQFHPGAHAHWLTPQDAENGNNFFSDDIHEQVKARDEDHKGIDLERTQTNMLSSQAMCFNIFGNLRFANGGLAVAAKALRHFVPTILDVKKIEIEYTPSKTIFGDQSARGGVDCDVMIEYSAATGGGLLSIETKFVEPEFSICGFQKKTSGRKVRRTRSRSSGAADSQFDWCRYAKDKGYLYWDCSLEMQTLKPEVLQGPCPCPFRGGLWQLWVNHTLVHKVARERTLQEATFAVCAPKGNDALLKGGSTIEAFRSLLRNPSSMLFIGLEDLIEALEQSLRQDPLWGEWITYLKKRYLIR